MEQWREDVIAHYNHYHDKLGRFAENPNYSERQRNRDINTYGKLAANRIDKRTRNGEQVSSARAKEADRINSARKTARVSGTVGSVVGSVSLFALGSVLGKKYLNSLGPSYISELVGGIAGSGLGAILGRYMGQSVPMLLRGYKPSKLR